MFFLKELPTSSMVQRYSKDYFPQDACLVSQRLKMLRDASTLVRRIEQYFASLNISQLKFLILMVIDRELERDWLYAHEIAERLDVSKPVLSRAIKSLVDSGFIQTDKDKNDARAVMLTLTNDGKAKFESLLPGYFDILVNGSDME